MTPITPGTFPTFRAAGLDDLGAYGGYGYGGYDDLSGVAPQFTIGPITVGSQQSVPITTHTVTGGGNTGHNAGNQTSPKPVNTKPPKNHKPPANCTPNNIILLPGNLHASPERPVQSRPNSQNHSQQLQRADRQRHREKLREAIRDNIADIISEESIIGRDRDRII